MAITARVIATSSARVGQGRARRPVDLETVIGKRFRWPSDEYPMPKSSMAKPTPRRRSDSSFSPPPVRVLHHDALGDLELEVTWGRTRSTSRIAASCRHEIVLVELARGQVDRDRQLGSPAVLPRLAALRRPSRKRPESDRHDQSGRLGERNEPVGSQQAVLGMLPAQQRLDAGDAPRARSRSWAGKSSTNSSRSSA